MAATHDELVKLRLHFFEQHTARELVAFFKGERGPVDRAGKEAIAMLLFGEDTTVEEAARRIEEEI